MNKIKTLVVDDEPLAREGVILLLKDDPEIEIAGECKDGFEAVEVINNNPIDLVFLDVEMPGMDCFETLSHIKPGKMPVIIFATAFGQYAIKAFKAHAVDYLLKPYSDDEFCSALKKAKEYISLKNIKEVSLQLSSLLGNIAASPVTTSIITPAEKDIPVHEYKNHIPVSTAGTTTFVRIEDIDWIEAADYYVQLHVKNKVHLIRETMDNLECQLDPRVFVRIHRSTIVNISRIKEIQHFVKGDYIAVLNDQTKLKISRNYKGRLKKIMNMN